LQARTEKGGKARIWPKIVVLPSENGERSGGGLGGGGDGDGAVYL